MRVLACLFLSIAIFSHAAVAADALQTAVQLQQAGAPHLALARVLRDQPAQPAAPLWYDWESLRLSLLSATGQADAVVARFKLAPDGAPRDFQQKALGHYVWALLEQGQGEAARRALTRLLWQFDLSPADQQWGRRLVIRSYLVEHRPAEAYRAMLRYQQDYQPLAQEVTADFVQNLLAEGDASDAVTWMAQLDAGNPDLLALQLKSGLVAPSAALSQALGAIQGPRNALRYAAIAADAAEQINDGRQQIMALERGLNTSDASAARKPLAQRLWQAYQREAEILGNLGQVLRGDDLAWLALASSSTADAPGMRALYAYCVGRATNADVRETAQAQLFAQLVATQLGDTALALFEFAPWNPQDLSEQALDHMVQLASERAPPTLRRELLLAAGRLQSVRRQHLAAADYFAQAVLQSDLRAPDALALQALQQARTSLDQAGLHADSESLQRFVAAQKAPPAQAVSHKPAGKGKRKK